MKSLPKVTSFWMLRSCCRSWCDVLALWITEGLRVTTGVLAKTDTTTRNSVVVRFHVS
jgi:hypothetical protein